MVNLIYIFWMYVILFAIIGAMRGWAKELLVTFSVILVLAINHLLFRYVEMFRTIDPKSLFWVRVWITIPLIYFGYQTVGFEKLNISGKARKDKLQDALFGAVMGGFNGYLVMGTLWSYLHDADYPFPSIFYEPTQQIAVEIARMMAWMPPHAFGEPGIYFAVMIAFVFVIVVFV